MKRRILAFVERVKKTRHRGLRITIGVLLIIGGIFGALPVVGFWMLPLGLALLSVDCVWARRATISLKRGWRSLRRTFSRKNRKKQAPDDGSGD